MSWWVPADSVLLVFLSAGLVMVMVAGCVVVMVRVMVLLLMVLILVLVWGLGHPVVLTGVFCVLMALFCAVMMVGIVSFCAQRLLPGAASTECGPWGRIVSKVLMEASGTVSNLES